MSTLPKWFLILALTITSQVSFGIDPRLGYYQTNLNAKAVLGANFGDLKFGETYAQLARKLHDVDLDYSCDIHGNHMFAGEVSGVQVSLIVYLSSSGTLVRTSVAFETPEGSRYLTYKAIQGQMIKKYGDPENIMLCTKPPYTVNGDLELACDSGNIILGTYWKGDRVWMLYDQELKLVWIIYDSPGYQELRDKREAKKLRNLI